MGGSTQTIDAKQAFRCKAACFSFLAPLSCVLIFFVSLSLMNHFSPDIQGWIFKFVAVGTFIIQIISVIMGAFGMRAESILANWIAAIGIVISGIVGFLAFILSDIAIWGLWRGC
jgi:hypothetical protein